MYLLCKNLSAPQLIWYGNLVMCICNFLDKFVAINGERNQWSLAIIYAKSKWLLIIKEQKATDVNFVLEAVFE